MHTILLSLLILAPRVSISMQLSFTLHILPPGHQHFSALIHFFAAVAIRLWHRLTSAFQACYSLLSIHTMSSVLLWLGKTLLSPLLSIPIVMERARSSLITLNPYNVLCVTLVGETLLLYVTLVGEDLALSTNAHLHVISTISQLLIQFLFSKRSLAWHAHHVFISLRVHSAPLLVWVRHVLPWQLIEHMWNLIQPLLDLETLYNRSR